MRLHAVLQTIAGLLLGGCSAIDMLNATAEHTGIDITKDVAYADGPRHKLDVYAPRGARGAPLAIFYYGGGWESGAKEMYPFVAAALAARGVITIVADYRIYPEVRFPGFLTDAALVARWAKDHAVAYGADPGRLVLIGHSAGAHIAAMLTLDKQWLAQVGLDPKRDLAGAVGIAGPYDFLPLESATLQTIFGAPEQLAQTQPINFADGNAPPMLLITGGFDWSVDPDNSMRLAARIKEHGGDVRTIEYPLIGHILVLGAIARPLRLFAPTLRDMSIFINELPPASSAAK